MLANRSIRVLTLLAIVVVVSPFAKSADDELAKVSEVFRRYCAGCHNESENEADLLLANLEQVRKANLDGKPVVVAGKSAESPLWKVVSGNAQPKMPPKDEPQPSQQELALIKEWIDGGANLPIQSSMPINKPAERNSAANVSSACGLPENRIALGSFERLQVADLKSNDKVTLAGFEGKITSLRLSADGKLLIVGSGRVGVSGQVSLVDSATLKVLQQLQGHKDIVYCATVSADGKWLASGSYDRKVIVWDVTTGKQITEINGHNGAIYDLDFNPSSTILATASGDQTVKLWSVPDGARLDTLGQPEGEMRCVRFSYDGKLLYAAGGDRQVRQWLVDPSATAGSPMLLAKFAHEREVVRLEMLDNSRILTASADGRVKLWRTIDLMPLGEIAVLPSYPVGICKGPQTILVDLKGNTVSIDIDANIAGNPISSTANSQSPTRMQTASAAGVSSNAATTKFVESEPNNDLNSATSIQLPAELNGSIHTVATEQFDIDLYRFEARRGQPWIFEIFAATEKSPLDSFIDILDVHGQPVLQTRLQALRETYFTFRGKDSLTSDDFRMHKWEDMELDEYLFSNGEVTRLWLYPRGPDSGFKVYPGSESRYTYFGTTPVSHALGEPAYIVRPLNEDEAALPNGLPVFPVYYENDDDPLRERGADSRLTFRAPADGTYLLRVRDSRGFAGQNYHYRISVRQPNPDFALTFGKLELTVPQGSGREWSVKVKRTDEMNSPIAIRLHGLPEGVLATNPVIIQANQLSALGNIYVTTDFQPPNEPIVISLSAETVGDAGEPPIVKQLTEHIKLTVNQEKELKVSLVSKINELEELSEIVVRPGTTSSAMLRIERSGVEGGVGFGKEDSGRNLVHGSFVDNIGLNGLLIVEGQSSREVFITAAPKVKPGKYQFHFRSESKGNPTSKPIWLNVQP